MVLLLLSIDKIGKSKGGETDSVYSKHRKC